GSQRDDPERWARLGARHAAFDSTSARWNSLSRESGVWGRMRPGRNVNEFAEMYFGDCGLSVAGFCGASRKATRKNAAVAGVVAADSGAGRVAYKAARDTARHDAAAQRGHLDHRQRGVSQRPNHRIHRTATRVY